MKLTFSSVDSLFFLVLIGSIFGLIFSFYKSGSSQKLRPILYLRGFLFFILIFLFLDPKLERTQTNSKELPWHVYLDRSLSMSYHSQPSVGSLVSGVEQIVKRLHQNNIELKVIGFGNDLDTSWSVGNNKITDGSTDFGQVIKHIQSSENDGLAGSIIITDGQANLGAEIPSQNIGISSPIHVIGVGDETPLVDVAIHAIDAPPVIIKGEKADIDVTIASHGKINERLNVTINSGNKLLGSKVVSVAGNGSLDRIRFRITPTQTGETKYRVQVNVLSDEINIQNNKQVVPVQVLKSEYKVALFTGAPNFNTQIIKQILSKNPEYRIDHYVYHPVGYSKNLKTFWDTKYDLIIFDNHPIKENAKEWSSYLRIFAKKMVSHQSSLAFILGNDVHIPTFESYLSLMDVGLLDPVLEMNVPYDWELNTNWDSFFPFHQMNRFELGPTTLPPLVAQFEIDSLKTSSLANFTLSEVVFPLFVIGEKSPLRFMIWASPELFKLYLKTKETDISNLTHDLFNPVFSWLMRTGNGQDFYFRSEKNSYQQGERVTISGKPIRETEIAVDGFLHILKDRKKINTKPLKYDEKLGQYIGQFWASQSGQLDYEIELKFGDKSLIVGDGSIQVQESQVELNHVYLNKGPLTNLAEMNGGTFTHWDNRLSIIKDLSIKIKVETHVSKSVLHDSWWMLVFIIGILSGEWILRRHLGLM